MKLGVIAPVPALRQLAIGTIHLVLTSWVLTNADYANFYRERSEAGDYIILDNDAHENREASSIDLLLMAAHKVRPSEIVLPDDIRNAYTTAEKSYSALAIIKRYFPDVAIMAVPQGSTEFEWHLCLQTHLQGLGTSVNTIGIPRVFADDFGTWVRAVGYVQEASNLLQQKLDIHLLGSPYNIDSAGEVEREFPGVVRSTDTAKPVHYAIAGKMFDFTTYNDGARDIVLFNPEQRNDASRPSDFLSFEMNLRQLKLAENNISLMRVSIGDVD